MDHRTLLRHGPPLRAGLIAAGLLLTLPAFAAEPAASHLSPLAGVTALDQPVTYTETKFPLGELVAKVAADTGVKLTASAEVADEPVAVVVKAMPARELLEQLAELLDYRWRRSAEHQTPSAGNSTPAFEVYQDLAGKENEEALRQAAAARVWQRLQTEVQRTAEVASLPPAQFKAEMDAMEQRAHQLEAEPQDQEEAFLKSPEGQEWGHRAQALEAVSSPIAGVLAKLVGRLTPRQWALLRSQPELVLSSGPEAGAAPETAAAPPAPVSVPLPGEIVRLLRAASPYTPPIQHAGPPDPAQPERDRQWAKDRQAYWASATGYRVTLRLNGDQYERSGKLVLSAQVMPVLGEPLPQGVFNIPAGTLRLESPLADANPPPEADSPARRAALESDPVLGRKEPFKPKVKPSAGPITPGVVYVWRLVDLLPELAQTYHAQFISDAYWSSGLLMGLHVPAEPTTLFAQLDALAGPGFQWEQHGDLIRLRSRSWFLERPREVPLRFVRQWQEDHRRYGFLTLEDYLAMATGMTDLQLRSAGDLMNLDVAALPTDLYEMREAYPARFALRLYASLTPAQQQSCAAGKLPVAQMTRSQQALFLAGLQEPDPHYGLPPAPAPAPSQPDEEASFAVSTRRWTRTVEKTEEGFTSYETPEPAPNGEPGPGAGASSPVVRATGPVSPPAPGAPPAGQAARGGASPGPARPQSGRHSFTRLELLLSGGSKGRRSFNLDVALP